VVVGYNWGDLLQSTIRRKKICHFDFASQMKNQNTQFSTTTTTTPMSNENEKKRPTYPFYTQKNQAFNNKI
jgi:hypothetical protein